MANPRLEVDIVADDKQARASMKRLETAGTNTTASIAKGFALAQVGIAAAGKAIQAATGFVKGAISASNEQIAAITKLNAALESQGNFTQETSQAIQDFAADMQSMTTIGDEATIAVAAQIEAMTGLGGEALPKATQAAIQLSKAYGIDLKAATALVGKELTSTTSALTRYGIQIDKSASQTDQLNQLLDATESGMAIAKAEALTFEGQLMQLDNAYGDLQESIGAIITDNQTLAFGIGQLTEVVKGIINNVDTWFQNNKAIAEQITGDLMNAIILLVQGGNAVVTGFTEIILGAQAVTIHLEAMAAAADGDFWKLLDLAGQLKQTKDAFFDAVVQGALLNQELIDLRTEIDTYKPQADAAVTTTANLATELANTATAAKDAASGINKAAGALEGYNFEWMIFSSERGGNTMVIPGGRKKRGGGGGTATTPPATESFIVPTTATSGGATFAAAGIRPRGGLPIGGFPSQALTGARQFGDVGLNFQRQFASPLMFSPGAGLSDVESQRGSSESNPLIVKVVGPSMNLAEAVV
jgi:hypothetical protein